MQPEARYARLGEDRIAYQVLGEGPPDLIVFDRRGTGASDPQPPGSLPPWESYGQDLTAVLDEGAPSRPPCWPNSTPARWPCSSPGPDPNAPGR